MSATEIIQQIKTMPMQERRAVFQFLTEDLQSPTSLYDEFTVLGEDPDALEFGKHSTFNAQHSTPNQDIGESWTLREGDAGARKFDLENRLLEFASAVFDLTEKLPSTRAGNHVAGQLLRCGTSPYPNHAEAEAAESREDFIHKLKICLKELRETRRWGRLIQLKGWTKNEPTLLFVLGQCDELIRIFFCSVKTARQNSHSEKRGSENPIRPPAGQSGQAFDVQR